MAPANDRSLLRRKVSLTQFAKNKEKQKRKRESKFPFIIYLTMQHCRFLKVNVEIWLCSTTTPPNALRDKQNLCTQQSRYCELDNARNVSFFISYGGQLTAELIKIQFRNYFWSTHHCGFFVKNHSLLFLHWGGQRDRLAILSG